MYYFDETYLSVKIDKSETMRKIARHKLPIKPTLPITLQNMFKQTSV